MPSAFVALTKPSASPPTPETLSSVTSTEIFETPDFRWVGLRKVDWCDPLGTRRHWECAFRKTRRSECDGVSVMAFVKYPKSGLEDELVLVTQFRPPVAAEVLETPAGLVDAGEDAIAAAQRELFEETGLRGKVTQVSPITPCDPGLTDANMRCVTIEIDGDAEENRNAQAHPHEGEFITIRRLPVDSILEELQAWAGAGFEVDARLYAVALGYVQGKKDARRSALGAIRSGGNGEIDGCSGSGKLCARRVGCYAVYAGAVIGALFVGRWMGRRSVR